MLDTINLFLQNLVGYLWSLPLILLLLGGGVFFTLYLGMIQFKGFIHAITVASGKYDQDNEPGEISHFRALCTALSGTVGLGNIAGVAVAIQLGGPGATFWMILVGILGMALKYSEVTLSVKFRQIDKNGHVHGGPMYVLSEGIPTYYPNLRGFGKFLGKFFAICCAFASFGAANMFQTNQVALSLNSSFGVNNYITGIVIAVVAAIVIVGGIERIGKVAGTLVPVMGVSYVLACLAAILLHLDHLPEVFINIINGAFNGTAAVGGFAGATLRTVIVQGMRRAVFSCEAGMGSAAIAHSAVKTKEPVSEGTVALLEPFIDTVVICTMTALMLNFTDVWQLDLTGVAMTQAALNTVFPGFGTYFIPLAVTLFAFSTIISWSYYGEQCVDYLFGPKAIIPYKVLYCIFSFLGAIWAIEPIINFSDSCIALMVVPNFVGLILLAKVLKSDTKKYFEKFC